MKIRTAFLITLLTISGLISAQTNLTKADKCTNEIMKVLVLQERAWNNGNLDSFMLFYHNSSDLRFISKKGVKTGWNEVYSSYKKNYSDKGTMGKLTFSIKYIDRLNRKNALVTGSWKVENKEGIIEGYFTLWFKKIKGSWVIVQDHTS